AGGMKRLVIPPPVVRLRVENEAQPGAPRALDVARPMARAERDDDVEEAHRMARGVEVGPARVFPAPVRPLRSKEVVACALDGTIETFAAEHVVAAQQHQAAECRQPRRAVALL